MSTEQSSSSNASSQEAQNAQNQSESSESQESLQAGSSQEAIPSEAAIDSDPNLTPVEKKEVKKMLKSLKLKFNGREVEEQLPFEIPDTPESIEYMKKQLQMSRLAQSKSQELSHLQKEAAKFIEDLRKNPRKVLSDPTIGVDLKKMAVEMIEEEIENARKSPEQLEREKLESELKAMKEEREREKEENRKRDMDRIQQQEYERYDMLLSQALDKTDLPKTPYTVKKIADYMIMAVNSGMDVTPEDVIPLVREEMQNDLKEMFSVMPEDVVEQLVGKDVINKIRRKNLQKARSVQAVAKPQIKDSGIKAEEPKNDGSKKKPMRDFFGF